MGRRDPVVYNPSVIRANVTVLWLGESCLYSDHILYLLQSKAFLQMLKYISLMLAFENLLYFMAEYECVIHVAYAVKHMIAALRLCECVC